MIDLLPAIDLRKGRVVRLEQGDADRATIYSREPVEVLDQLISAGVEWVHVVDLDAAFGEEPQRSVLTDLVKRARALANNPIRLEVGGGFSSTSAIAWALEAGFERVVVGSLLARDPEGFARLCYRFPDRLVAAVEVDGDAVRIAGWRETAATPWRELAAGLRDLPTPAVLVTDISRDGMLSGANVQLAREVASLSGVPSIVSGGIRSLADVEAAAASPGVGGVIVGRALYEGRIDLREALGVCRSRLNTALTNLTRRVIPCLDVDAGWVVKGVRFEGLREIGDPAEYARRYEEQGADELVFLDITAAPERRETDLAWVEKTAAELFIPMTVGGGVRSCADADQLLRSGADKIALNTAALDRPELLNELAREFGTQCVVVSVDAKRTVDGWEVVTHGGRSRRGRDVIDWLGEATARGAGEVLLTSIDSDGTLDGYDLELLAAVVGRVDVPVIASGGAGTLQHLADALETGVSAVLAASIFHDGVFRVGEVKEFLASRGYPVREVGR